MKTAEERGTGAGYWLVLALSLVVVIAEVKAGVLRQMSEPFFGSSVMGTPVEPPIHLAKSRLEAVEMALISHRQSVGESARCEWENCSTDQERYAVIAPYLAFAPRDWNSYAVHGYPLILPVSFHDPPVMFDGARWRIAHSRFTKSYED